MRAGTSGVVADDRADPILRSGRLHCSHRAQTAFQDTAEMPECFLSARFRLGNSWHQHREHRRDTDDRDHGDPEQHQVQHTHQHNGPDGDAGRVDDPDHRARRRLAQ